MAPPRTISGVTATEFDSFETPNPAQAAPSGKRRRIAHLDMDAFFASVELLRYPQLKGLPVVIGGGRRKVDELLLRGPDGTAERERRFIPVEDFPLLKDYVGRGVITTATYPARQFGVGSAMGMMKAARLCPQAILLPVDFAEYRRYSRRFKEEIVAIAPVMEDRGVDEVYIDFTAVPGGQDEGGRALARRLQQAILGATGLTCSIGVAPNKLLAKMASEFNKPNGISIVQPEDLQSLIWPLPCRKINGIGPKADQAKAGGPELPRGDRRFADPRWREHPLFAVIHQTYLMLAEQILAMVDAAEEGEPAKREQLRFAAQMLVDALSPSNFPLTNPVALERAIETRGESLVKGMEHLMGQSIGPSISIRTDFPADLPPAETDPNQLESALLNLVLNARDAMPRGGSIVISAQATAHPPADLTHGPYLRLTVADTGEGMDPAAASRAMEPFFTTKGVGKGTGLGLSMVQGLAQQSGGKLELTSRQGQGTNVHLWLPVSYKPVIDRPCPTPATAPRAMRPLTVLAVDDDELVLRNTAAMLEDLGHTVLQASSGKEALALLRAGAAADCRRW